MKCRNKVELLGNVGNVEKKENCLKLSLATSESWKNNNGEEHEKIMWHTITIFEPYASKISNHIQKGDRLLIDGKIENSKYEKNGIERFSTEIIAHDVTFLSLKE